MLETRDTLALITKERDMTEINWQPICKGVHGGHVAIFDPMALKVQMSITKSPKTKHIKKNMRVRFGVGLLNAMGWQQGDKILVCFNPNDNHELMIVANKNGYNLTGETAGRILRVCTISFNGDFIQQHKSFPSIEQKYQIDKKNKRIFLRLSLPGEEGFINGAQG